MRAVTCSLGASADGYIAGPDGSFDWAEPDPELFRFTTDEVRGLAAHLMGRRLYEAMLYWEDVADAALGADELAFARLWRALSKVVFSRTLTQVRGANTRLADAGLAEEIARLRAEPGGGNIGVGGAGLAAETARLGLLDEYRLRTFPVIVGGGTPFFPQGQGTVALEVLGQRDFAHGVRFTHYRVRR